MRVARHLLGVAVALSFATTANAQAIVYDNGFPNALDGNDMSEYTQAEDFSFLSATYFNGIRFFGIEVSPAVGPINIDWAIFTDALGNPGTQLFGGTATSTRTFLGFDLTGFEEWQNDLATGPITLGPGSYWLTLHEGADFNSRAFFWETTDANGTASGKQVYGGSGLYMDNGNEHAFAFTATVTPEPASMVLVATGLLGVFGVARRRKQNA